MTKEKKQIELKSLVTILFMVFVFINSGFARIDCNKAGGGYEENSSCLSINQSLSIEEYIELGGGYYLKSNSFVQEFLKIVELQDVDGINFDELRFYINCALENMEKASEAYQALIEKAESTPYKSTVIEALIEFDYNEFRISSGFNRTIFGKVEEFLVQGNITGVFKYKENEFKEIKELLMVLKCAIDLEMIPELSQCWQLNERFAELSLFGSYVARVFYTVMK